MPVIVRLLLFAAWLLAIASGVREAAAQCVPLPSPPSNDVICYDRYANLTAAASADTTQWIKHVGNTPSDVEFSVDALRGVSTAQSDVLSLLLWQPPLPTTLSNLPMDEVVYAAEGGRSQDAEPSAKTLCSACSSNGTTLAGSNNSTRLSVPLRFAKELDPRAFDAFTASVSMRQRSVTLKGFLVIACEDGYWEGGGASSPLDGFVAPVVPVSSFAVYYSIYVDSEARTIAWQWRSAYETAFVGETFAMEDLIGSDGSTVNIFDGGWHLIAFTVQPSSAEQTTLQLYIDGKSSESKAWNRCLYDATAPNTGIEEDLDGTAPSVATPNYLSTLSQTSPPTTGAQFIYLGWVTAFGVVASGGSLSLFNFQLHEGALSQRQLIGLGSQSMLEALPISKDINFKIGLALVVIACAFVVLIGVHAYLEVFGVIKTHADSLNQVSAEAGYLASAGGAKVGAAVSSAKGVAAQVAQLSAQSALRSSSLGAESSITAPLRQIQTITPYIVVVWQNLAMYLRIWDWPPEFSAFVSKLAIIFALDLTLPELRITPAVTFFLQFALGVLLLFFIYCIAEKDRRVFQSSVTRFRASLELSILLAQEALATKEEGPAHDFLRNCSTEQIRSISTTYVTQSTNHAVWNAVRKLTTDDTLVEKVVTTVVVKLTEALRVRDPMELLLTIFVRREQLRLSEVDVGVIAARLYTVCASLNLLSPDDLLDEYRINVFDEAVSVVNRLLPSPMRPTSEHLLVGMLHELGLFLEQCDADMSDYYKNRWSWAAPQNCTIQAVRILSMKEMRRSQMASLGNHVSEYKLWARMALISEDGAANALPDRANCPQPLYTVHFRQCTIDNETSDVKFLKKDAKGNLRGDRLFRMASLTADGTISSRQLKLFLQCAHRLASSPTLSTISVAQVDVVAVDSPQIQRTWENTLLVRHNGELFLKVGCSSKEKERLSQLSKVRAAAHNLWGELARIRKRYLETASTKGVSEITHHDDDSTSDEDVELLAASAVKDNDVASPDSGVQLYHVEVQSPDCLYCPLHQVPLIDAPESTYHRRYGDGTRAFKCCHSDAAAYKLCTRARQTATSRECARGSKVLLNHLTTVVDASSSSSSSSSDDDDDAAASNVRLRNVKPLQRAKSSTSTKLCPPVISCDGDRLLVCRHLCGYTVCATCVDIEYRPLTWTVDSLVQMIYVKAQEGQLIFVLLFVAAQSLLYPITQNCFMILACHPIFRCDFPSCYDDPSPTFLTAIVMALFVLIFFRIGIALLWTIEIAGRKLFLQGLVRYRDGQLLAPGEAPAAAPSIWQSAKHAITSSEENVMWNWYLAMDNSVMSSLYRKLEFPYMSIDPMLQLGLQCGLSVISAFTAQDTLGQVIAIATVECTYCSFLSIVNMYTDPWLDILAKLGSVHQILQIGWLSFHRSILFDHPTSTQFALVMIATAACYIVVVVAITYHTVVSPWLAAKMDYLFQGFLRREVSATHEENLTTREERLGAILREKRRTYGKKHFQCVITSAILARNHWEWQRDEDAARDEIRCVIQDLAEALDTVIRRVRSGDESSGSSAGTSEFDFGGYLLDADTLETLREVVLVFHRMAMGDDGTDTEDDRLRSRIETTLWNVVLMSRDFPLQGSNAAANALMLLCALQVPIGSSVLQPFYDRDLSGVSIAGADVTGSAFVRVSFREANLTSVKFERCFFENVDFTDAVTNNCTFGMQVVGNRAAFSAAPFECSVGCGVLLQQDVALVADVENIGLRLAFLDALRYDDALITGHGEAPLQIRMLTDPQHQGIVVSVDATGKVMSWRGIENKEGMRCATLVEEFPNASDAEAKTKHRDANVPLSTDLKAAIAGTLADLIGVGSETESDSGSELSPQLVAPTPTQLAGTAGASGAAPPCPPCVCPCVSVVMVNGKAVVAAMHPDGAMLILEACAPKDAAPGVDGGQAPTEAADSWSVKQRIPVLDDFVETANVNVQFRDVRFVLMPPTGPSAKTTTLVVAAKAGPKRLVAIVCYTLLLSSGGTHALVFHDHSDRFLRMRTRHHRAAMSLSSGAADLLMETCANGALLCAVSDGLLTILAVDFTGANDRPMSKLWENAALRSKALVSAVDCTCTDRIVLGHTSGLVLVHQAVAPDFPRIFSYRSTGLGSGKPIRSVFCAADTILCCYTNSAVERISMQAPSSASSAQSSGGGGGGTDAAATMMMANDVRALPLPTYRAAVNDIAFSPDGDTLAVCNNSPTVDLVYMSDGSAGHLSGHSDEVSCIAFSNTDILSVSKDGTANWWRDGRGIPAEMAPDVAKATSEVSITEDGHYALCCGFEQVWCFRLMVEEGNDNAVQGVTFIRLWDVKAPKIMPQCCFFAPDHLHVVVLSVLRPQQPAPGRRNSPLDAKHTVTWYDIETGMEAYSVVIPFIFSSLPDRAEEELIFSATPDGRYICGCSGQEYFVFSLVDGSVEEYVCSTEAARRVENVVVAPRSAQCVLVKNFTGDPISMHWPGRESVDITTRQLHRIGFCMGTSRVVGFNRGSNAIEGFDVNTVQLPCRYVAGYSLDLQDEPATANTKSRIAAAAISVPDGTALVTVGTNRTVALWDVATGRLLACTVHFTTHRGVEGSAALVLAPVAPPLAIATARDAGAVEVEENSSAGPPEAEGSAATTPTILVFCSKGLTAYYSHVLDELLVVERITESSVSCRVRKLPAAALSATPVFLNDPLCFAVGTLQGKVQILVDSPAAGLAIQREIQVNEGPVTSIAAWRYGFFPDDGEAVLAVASCAGTVRFFDFGQVPTAGLPPPIEVVTEAEITEAGGGQTERPLSILLHPAGHLMMASSSSKIAMYELRSTSSTTSGAMRRPSFHGELPPPRVAATAHALEGLQWVLLSQRIAPIAGTLFRPRAFAVPRHYTNPNALWDEHALLIRGSRAMVEGAKISFCEQADQTKQTYSCTPGAALQLMVGIVGGTTVLVDDKDVTFYSAETPRFTQLYAERLLAPLQFLHEDALPEVVPLERQPLCGTDTLVPCHQGLLVVPEEDRTLTYLATPWHSTNRPPPKQAVASIPIPGVRMLDEASPSGNHRCDGSLPAPACSVHILVSDVQHPSPRPRALALCCTTDGTAATITKYRLPSLAVEASASIPLSTTVLGPHRGAAIVMPHLAVLSCDGKYIALLLQPIDDGDGAAAPTNRVVECSLAVFATDSGAPLLPVPLHLGTAIARRNTYAAWRSYGGYDTDTRVDEEEGGTNVSNTCPQQSITHLAFSADASMLAVCFGSSGAGAHAFPLTTARRQLLYKDHGLQAAEIDTICRSATCASFHEAVYWPKRWWQDAHNVHRGTFGNLPVPIGWAYHIDDDVQATYLIPTFDYAITAIAGATSLKSIRGRDEFQLENETALSAFPSGLAVKMPSSHHRSLHPPSRVAVTVGAFEMLEVFTLHPHTGAFLFVYRSSSAMLASASKFHSFSVSPTRSAPERTSCTLRFETINLTCMTGTERKSGNNLLSVEYGDVGEDDGEVALHAEKGSFFADVYSSGTAELTSHQRKVLMQKAHQHSDEHPPAVFVFHHKDASVELFPHADATEMKYHPSRPNFFVETAPLSLVRNVVHPGL